MAEPQRGRSELDAYAVALLGDNPTDPIEPEALRRVLKADRYAATNLADDGAPGGGSGGGSPYVLPGPNLRKDAEKRVKWLTVAQADAEDYGASSLQGLPSAGLCLNAEAVVELYDLPGQPRRTRVRLALRYDNDPASFPEALRTTAYEDGNFRGVGNIPGVWLEVGTMQEAANGRRYASSITNWQADENTKILFPGDTSDSFFTALQAGGPFPSPVKDQTDAYWRPAAAPQPQVAFAVRLTLLDAQAIEGSGVQERGYLITGTPAEPGSTIGTWNNSGSSEAIYVLGYENYFGREGVLVDVSGQPVERVMVNVGAGTYEAVGSGLPETVQQALEGATNPSAGNPFATLADVPAQPYPVLAVDEFGQLIGYSDLNFSNPTLLTDYNVGGIGSKEQVRIARQQVLTPQAYYLADLNAGGTLLHLRSGTSLTVSGLQHALLRLQSWTMVQLANRVHDVWVLASGGTIRFQSDAYLTDSSLGTGVQVLAGTVRLGPGYRGLVNDFVVSGTGQVIDERSQADPQVAANTQAIANEVQARQNADNLKANRAGDTFTGDVFSTGAGASGPDATNASRLITQGEFANAIAGLAWKNKVRLATQVNVTLTGLPTVDGVQSVAGNRILVRAQTDATQNGIYRIPSGGGAWTRSTDTDTWDELVSATVRVSEGTASADKAYTCTADAGGTLGSTALPWVDVTGGQGYNFGTGLALSGNNVTLNATTDLVPEASSNPTNKYFTTARVLATTLAGLTAAAGSPAATDTIVQAWGKVKNFIDSLFSTANSWSALQTFASATIASLKLGSDATALTGSFDPNIDPTGTLATSVLNGMPSSGVYALNSAPSGSIVGQCFASGSATYRAWRGTDGNPQWRRTPNG